MPGVHRILWTREHEYIMLSAPLNEAMGMKLNGTVKEAKQESLLLYTEDVKITTTSLFYDLVA